MPLTSGLARSFYRPQDKQRDSRKCHSGEERRGCCRCEKRAGEGRTYDPAERLA